MIDIHDGLYKDFEAVRKISIVPSMLDVICQTTGMGFAAIARVTDNRWLACSVLDNVRFGLEAGSELKIETTICNEIKDNRKAVIIDDVANDLHYQHHHTPKLYGLQSYISFPILLKNGDFFGTLCAIDAKPAQLNNPAIIGMFTMFAELLSFHLQSLDLIERGHSALRETSRQLNYSTDENLQYRQISNHNLQEPLRKIRLYSDLLENKTGEEDIKTAKKIAGKIKGFATELTAMIEHITEFSALSAKDSALEKVDLNKTVQNVYSQLGPKLMQNKISLEYSDLPTVGAMPVQMAQLFFQLINYLISFPKSDTPTTIRIYASPIKEQAIKTPVPTESGVDYCEILLEHTGHVLEPADLEHVFDIFIHLSDKQAAGKYGAGLAYCRKIVHNHGGSITAKSLAGMGISFSILLPVGAGGEVIYSDR